MAGKGRITEKITIWGTVQGVGFRPFAAKLADSMGMCGEVRNAGGLVEIRVTDTEGRIGGFLAALKEGLPPPGEIVHVKREILEEKEEYSGFGISESSGGDDEASALPADLAVCPRCLKELRDPGDRRWMHPFISCMSCGPRYTIIDRTPYDRENTSMADFAMCTACRSEYTDRKDVRYHAQTVSCHDCGPMLLWRPGAGQDGPSDGGCSRPEALRLAAAAISGGGVIAFKATGGYCFVCSPFDTAALRALRRIKIREEKPFAVMFPDLDAIRRYCHVGDEEAGLLASAARPIVLLERKTVPGVAPISPEVCRDSRFIGAFLPSIGAQYMMAWELGPLIMTSANLSDMPIIKDDEEMWEAMRAQPRIAGALYNSRDIRVRMDDSVVRVIDGRPQMIRRSKGYVPSPIYISGAGGEAGGSVFAAGGHLKSAFALTKGKLAYVSQYFGDLDSVEAENVYGAGFERMKSLFRIEPELVVCDAHPLYASTRMAEEYTGRLQGTGDARPLYAGTRMAEEYAGQLPGTGDGVAPGVAHGGPGRLLRVQHHHAHIASVMAEHGLSDPVIGVAYDGTGYGTDGKIWGGEILLCSGEGFERMAHLKYVPMIGGDSSMKEAWKSAISYIYANGSKGGPAGLHERGSRSGSVNTHASASQGGAPTHGCGSLHERGGQGGPVNTHASASQSGAPTHSCGSLHERGGQGGPAEISIDISEIIAYGGELRHEHKDEVLSAIKAGINTIESSSMGRLFDAVASMLGMGDENRYEGECAIKLENAAAEALVRPGRNRAGDLALKFHMDVAAATADGCGQAREMTGVNQVALSGGVFQNKILMEECLRLLRNMGFSVYYNIAVPTNDGGIALGQAFIGLRHLEGQRQPTG